MSQIVSSDEKYQQGVELARRLFAGAKPAAPMSDDMRRYTMAHLFGDVWQDDALELTTRSLATCSVLLALGREAELALHLRGARNLGIERSTLAALITHVAHYAGWPAGALGFRVLDEVWSSMDANRRD